MASQYNCKIIKSDQHVKKQHNIVNVKKSNIFNSNIIKTNSYHNYILNNLNNKFDIFYVARDKSIEIAKIRKKKIFCFMFHPERRNISQYKINLMVKKIFE